jgi:predicted Zn-dependent peptidase
VNFYRRAYTAANAQIVIVGDLTLQQAQTLSRSLANALPAGPGTDPAARRDSPVCPRQNRAYRR